jgi:hypothetical protein
MRKQINWIRNEQEALRVARDRGPPVILDFYKEG